MSDLKEALEHIENLKVENIKLAVLLNRYRQQEKSRKPMSEDEISVLLGNSIEQWVKNEKPLFKVNGSQAINEAAHHIALIRYCARAIEQHHGITDNE
jgi:hypothetical protein